MNLAICNTVPQREEPELVRLTRDVRRIIDLIEKAEKERNRILVRFKNKILPICQDSIAFFQLEHNLVKLITIDQKVYFIPGSLQSVESKLSTSFFRVNRQFLVNRNAIADLTMSGKRSLTINLKFTFSQEIALSKHKYMDFLHWLS